jgi:hypothetical protein
LDWRDKIVAGYLAILGALGWGFSSADRNFRLVILGAVLLISVVFWIFEVRNRDLIHISRRAGIDLEITDGGLGVYSRLEQLGPNRGVKLPTLPWLVRRVTHGLAVNLLVGAAITSAMAGLVILSPWFHGRKAVVVIASCPVFLSFICFFEWLGDRKHNQVRDLGNTRPHHS